MNLALLFLACAGIVLPFEVFAPLAAFLLAARLVMEALARRAARRGVYVELFLNEMQLMAMPVAAAWWANTPSPMMMNIVVAERMMLLAFFWNDQGEALGTGWYYRPIGRGNLTLSHIATSDNGRVLVLMGYERVPQKRPPWRDDWRQYAITLACKSKRWAS